MVEEVGGLAGQAPRGALAIGAGGLGRGVVLGGDQDLGRLLGHLACRRRRRRRRAGWPCRSRPGASAARAAIVAHRVSSQREALRSSGSAGAPSGSKQLRVPRWQVGPTGRPSTRSASRVAVEARDRRRRRTLPLVSPFRQSRSRDREWKWTSPVSSVAASASASIQASIRTRPSAASWTIAGTSPSGPQRGSAERSGARHAAGRRRRPDGQAGGGHRRLDGGDRVDPAVEDRRREDRVGAAVTDRRHEVRRPGGAARRDDRDRRPRS